MLKELLSVKDVAEYLGLSSNYIRVLARISRIPARKLLNKEWRFRKYTIDEWLAHGCPSKEEEPSLFK